MTAFSALRAIARNLLAAVTWPGMVVVGREAAMFDESLLPADWEFFGDPAANETAAS